MWLWLRIVHLGNVWNGWGGTEATVRTLFNEMVKRGHECHAVTWETTYKRTDKRPNTVKGVIEHFIDGVQAKDETRHQYMMKQYKIALETAISLCDSDTVVYTVLFNHPQLWDKLRAKKIPAVHEYNMPRQSYYDGNGGIKYVFNSKWTKSWYTPLDGPIINPLTDLSGFDVKTSKKESIIGMVNPCRVKGIEIVRQLAIENPEMEFHIVGGWAHLSDPERMIEIPDLDNIVWCRHLPDISEFYNECDVVLMPTQDGHDESFGRVALEAMHHHCGVIASFKDGIPEAVDGGGELVGNYSEFRAWETAIGKVRDDIDHYINAGNERLKRYRFDEDANRWEKVFKEALYGRTAESR